MSTEEVSGQGEPGVAAQAASHLAAALARQPPPPVPIPLDVKHQEAKFKEARARMIKIVNWQVIAACLRCCCSLATPNQLKQDEFNGSASA